MNTKNLLTVFGAILGLQGIGLFVGAESITKEAFAAMNPDATGIAIGAMLHEVMGVMCVMVAIILLFARSLEPTAAAKILTAGSIGIALTVAQGVYHMVTTVVEPPMPLLVIMSILAILGFVTAMKTNGDSTGAA